MNTFYCDLSKFPEKYFYFYFKNQSFSYIALYSSFHHSTLNKSSVDLDADVTTKFGDEFWKRRESVTSVLTHVNLQS